MHQFMLNLLLVVIEAVLVSCLSYYFSTRQSRIDKLSESRNALYDCITETNKLLYSDKDYQTKYFETKTLVEKTLFAYNDACGVCPELYDSNSHLSKQDLQCAYNAFQNKMNIQGDDAVSILLPKIIETCNITISTINERKNNLQKNMLVKIKLKLRRYFRK